MKEKVHEIKNSGKIVGRVTTQVFETIEEATKTLGAASILTLVNRAYKDGCISKEKARVKAAGGVKDEEQADHVLKAWSKLTSEEERGEFCKWLGADKKLMKELEGKYVEEKLKEGK